MARHVGWRVEERVEMPQGGALGRALATDEFREALRFDAAGYRALRALVPEEARPN